MTFPRAWSAVVVLVSLSGCFLLKSIKASDAQTWSPVEQLLEQEKYAEASAELKRLHAELQPSAKEPNSLGRSPFGKQLWRLGSEGVLPVALEAQRLIADEKSSRVVVLAAARRGLEALAWVDGFPMDDLRDQLQTQDRFTELRAEFKAVEDRLAGISERQAALLTQDEAAGHTAVALHGWLRFLPENPAQERLRGQKIHALSRALAAASGGKYAVVAAKDAPAVVSEWVKAGQREALGTVRNAAFVPAEEADAIITVTGPAPKVKRSTKDVQAQWSYPTGQREVPNPKLRLYQERLQSEEKDAVRNRKAYDSLRCSGSGKGSVKAPAGTCAAGQYEAWQKAERNIESYRQRLANTQPRTLETVYAQHTYTAREVTVESASLLKFNIAFRKGRASERVEGEANVSGKFYTRTAEPRVNMPAQADKLPEDAEVLEALRDDAAEWVAKAVALARDGLAEDLEASRGAVSSKGDSVAEAEWALRIAAAKGEDPESSVVRALEKRLGEGLGAAPSANALLQPGMAALRHERLAGFAQLEAEAGRPASAWAAWVFIGKLADPELEARRVAAEDKAGKDMDAERPVQLTSSGGGAQGGPVAAALAEAARGRDGFKSGAGGAPLNIRVTAAAPRISRSSGDVSLEQEVVEEADDEEAPPPQPKKVPYSAKRTAATLEGTLSVKAEWGGRSLAFELPVTHVVEALTHPARAATGLRARNESLPADAELLRLWTKQAGGAALAKLLELVHAPAAEGNGPVLHAGLMEALRGKPVEEPGLDAGRLAPLLERTLGPVAPDQLDPVLTGLARRTRR